MNGQVDCRVLIPCPLLDSPGPCRSPAFLYRLPIFNTSWWFLSDFTMVVGMSLFPTLVLSVVSSQHTPSNQNLVFYLIICIQWPYGFPFLYIRFEFNYLGTQIESHCFLPMLSIYSQPVLINYTDSFSQDEESCTRDCHVSSTFLYISPTGPMLVGDPVHCLLCLTPFSYMKAGHCSAENPLCTLLCSCYNLTEKPLTDRFTDCLHVFVLFVFK